MERLTIRHSGNSGVISTNKGIAEVLNKLADYEDTGLTPTMVLDTIRARDTAQKQALENAHIVDDYRQAEENGLLLRLPCKVGTTVYYLNRAKGKVREAEVWKIGLLYDNKGAIYVNEKDMCFSFEALGKFWFLTREEAEQALKQVENTL